MCGIVGVLASRPAAPLIVHALRRLEYRGYDSSGVATLEAGQVRRRRAPGKLENLARRLANEPLAGRSGIGHTRWATHGKPTEANAHPHRADGLALVHNGIIENFRELRNRMEAEGVAFESETDTEVVAKLVGRELARGAGPVAAVSAVLPMLVGAFALAFLFDGEDDLLVAARRGAPLAVGLGDDVASVGSDALALASLAKEIVYLEDGDMAVVTRSGVRYLDAGGAEVERRSRPVPAEAAEADKGEHPDFMSKEIAEQPEVVARTLARYADQENGGVRLPFAVGWETVGRINLVACGTAYYAGLVAKHWFEAVARIPVDIDVASEFRYREAPLSADGLTLVVSQSGETADTLAGLRYAKQCGQRVLAVVNVQTSTIARESDIVMPTLAGPEIGVASTKAFTCQLAALAALALDAARARGIDAAAAGADEAALFATPGLMAAALGAGGLGLAEAVELIAGSRNALFLGRGPSAAMAFEGALKLKEISYIHAEAYAAGELKHGPIALVDGAMPVVVVAPRDHLFAKTVSNMHEVAARGGRIVLLSDEAGIAEADLPGAVGIAVPDVGPAFAPLVYAVLLQRLAHGVAVALGRDVDRPRNLAKSVTVE